MNNVQLCERVKGMWMTPAIGMIQAEGYTTRVVSVDGRKSLITADYNPQRINLEVRENMVIRAYIG